MTAPKPFDLDQDALLEGTTAIEASAGTGKTWSIEQIVVRRVLAGLSMDRMLLMTFTRSAASEMAARTRAALDESMRRLPVEQAKERGLLDHARNQFDAACITTIHGFCQRMLTEHAASAGRHGLEGWKLDPDPTGSARVACDDAWSAAAVRDGLLVLLAGSPQDHVERVLEVDSGRNAPSSQPSGHDPISPWRTSVTKCVREPGMAAAIRDLAERLLKAPKTASIALANAIECAAGKEVLSDLDLVSVVGLMDDNLVGASGALCSPEGAEAKTTTGTGKAVAGKVAAVRHIMSTPDWRARSAVLKECGSARESAVKFAQGMLAADALRRLAHARERSRTFSFHGLLVRMWEAVDQLPAFRHAVSSRFSLVIVDEVQDTDPVQSKILEQLFVKSAAPVALYLVGDPKQCIYEFRGARLASYLELRGFAQGQLRALRESRRSDRLLLQAIEHLFAVPMPFLHDQIGFDSVTSAWPTRRMSRDDGSEEPGIRVLRAPTKDFRAIAAGVAARICDDLVRGVRVQEGPLSGPLTTRTLAPRDITVLVAAHYEAATMMTALRKAQVPAVLIGKQSVFKSTMAREVFPLVAALAAPTNAAIVLAACAGRLIGGTSCSLDLDGAFRLRVRVAAATAARFGVACALRELVMPTLGGLAQETDAERAESDVLQLIELIDAAEASGCRGPRAIATWLAGRMKQPGDVAEEGSESRVAGPADAVRVRTIHSSKGLTFGVTWLPTVALAAKSGRSKTEDPTRDQGQEGRRLLYVGLTRSRWQSNVVWIPDKASAGSQLAPLIHARRESDITQVKDVAQGRLEAPALRDQDLHDLAASSSGSIEVSDLDRAALPMSWPAEETLVAPSRDLAAIPSPREQMSFTGLTKFVEHGSSDGNELDHDAEAVALPADSSEAATECDAALRQWGLVGRALGVALHNALEEREAFAALAEGADRRPLADAMARHGGRPDRASACEAVATTLASACAVEMPGTVSPCVAAIARGGRGVFRELKLATGWSGSPSQLGDAFDQEPHAWARSLAVRLRKMGPRHARGLFVGTLDLVCPHAGKWHIYDYKSNDLGTRAEAYSPIRPSADSLSPLDRAMDDCRYGLQAALYATALRWWLASRGVSAAGGESIIGGVVYLFFRGMDPAVPGQGVWTWSPSVALMDALSERLQVAPARGGA